MMLTLIITIIGAIAVFVSERSLAYRERREFVRQLERERLYKRQLEEALYETNRSILILLSRQEVPQIRIETEPRENWS